MNTQKIVHLWFKKWEEKDYKDLPISNSFIHTSPYGTIEGKKAYLDLVEANLDKFLGHEFKIHDELYENDRGSVRYTASKDGFVLEVSEWHYINDGLIYKIEAYYNIEGEISEERRLVDPGR